MSTFEVKLMILQSLGSAYTLENAESAYQWAIQEVNLEKTEEQESSVSHLTPVQ